MFGKIKQLFDFEPNFQPDPHFQTKFEQLLQLVSEQMFVFEQFLIATACPGASWQGDSYLFNSGGAPFLDFFFEMSCFCLLK